MPPSIDSIADLMESVRKQQAKTRQVIEETKAWLAEQEAPSRPRPRKTLDKRSRS
jgi:hypothetical protein